jgi:hypothetical protein
MAATMMLGLAASALAQNRDFYEFQYNTTYRELTVAQYKVQELEEEMSRTHDLTRGCSLLSDTIYKLGQMQTMLENMAKYAGHLQYGEDSRQASIEGYYKTTEHKAELQGKYDRLCK